jgi:uncharacterized protein (DUF58 family)
MLLLVLGFLFLSMVALPLLSITVGRLLVDDGIESFRSDPLTYKVARHAFVAAQLYRDSAVQRLIAPAGRVVSVTLKPGHCPQPVSSVRQQLPLNRLPGRPALEKGPEDPDATVMREYTAQVRFHTFFGYPIEEVYLECGGDSVSNQP